MYRREHFGVDSIQRLPELLPDDANQIALVTGQDSFEASGAKDAIEDALPSGFKRIIAPSPNPNLRLLKGPLKSIEDDSPDMLIAVGGGSVIDSAKALSTLPFQGADPVAYVAGSRSPEVLGIPLIAIPTTAGTGSETTHFATIYHDHEKFSVVGRHIYPTGALVDPTLLTSAPKSVRATSGADALTQAIEAYWSVNSTPASRRLAAEAIDLAWNSLETEVTEPTPVSRKHMAIAAHLAGKAIDIANTTACHSVAYPMTSHFDVDHGAAVALTLPSFFEYNADITEDTCQDRRGVGFVRSRISELTERIDATNPAEAAANIRSLVSRIGLPTTLTEAGIDEPELLIDEGFTPARMGNNPRLVTASDLRSILDDL